MSIPHTFGLYRGAHGESLRLSDDPILGKQLTDPILTTLVLNSGVVDETDSARAYLFPDEQAPSPLFEIRITKGEELLLRDTIRGASAKIETFDFKFDKRAVSLVRRTLAGLLEADALQIGAQYSLGATAAMIAREVVIRDCENEAATHVADEATTFGTNIITLTAGQEWNVVGMLASIEEAATLLMNIGVPKERLKLALFGNSLVAARTDPKLAESKSFTSFGATTLEQIRAYLGIGEVRGFNNIAKTHVDAPITRMYGNNAVLFYAGDSRLSSLLGSTAFGKTFIWGAGSALVPYYIDDRTSWAYPFQRWQKVEVLNKNAAVLIKDTYAA